jgi:release factor glutamine methyltransferase
MNGITIGDIQKKISDSLKKIDLTDREIKIERNLIIENTLSISLKEILLNQDKKIPDNQVRKIYGILERRIQHEPLAHIFGEWSFYGRLFYVNKHTLIPRPDTELIIDIILNCYKNQKGVKILDLGTGSGIIGITLSLEMIEPDITICDICPDALKVVSQNLQRFNIKNIKSIQSNWFQNIIQKNFDLIISNPPYIDENDIHLTQPSIIYEPKKALVSENKGLADIAVIINESKKYLRKEGRIIIEHGFDQANQIQNLFLTDQYDNIFSHQDINGKLRCTSATYNN